jgi:hypothetical protein
MTEPCPWCGGDADPATTCPKSLPCPTCHVGPGQRCVRPSGHTAAQLHAARIRQAETNDKEALFQ